MLQPNVATLTKGSAGILNAIRKGLGGEYAGGVPLASNTTEGIKMAGTAIMAYQSRQNAFVGALVNQIGFILVSSKIFNSPLGVFKRGILELGETTEEIFISMASVRSFQPQNAYANEFKRTLPNISVAFHAMNSKKEYPITVSQSELMSAFTTFDGLFNLTSKIVEQLYTAMYWDEYNMMKYTLAILALEGMIKTVVVDAPSATNSNALLTTIKDHSNRFTILSDSYNSAGVKNSCEKDMQYLIESSTVNAIIDVNSLASAFNMDKAEFTGHVVVVDDLGVIDWDRLKEFLADDPSFVEFNATQKGYLAKIDALLCSKNFYMVYDNLLQMKSTESGTGLFFNYFLHNWKTFSASPFENALILTHQASSVTSVSVSPATSTFTSVGKLQCVATVVTVGFAPQEVEWSISGDSDKVTVDQYGIVYVKTGAVDADYTVTATSIYDATKSDTCVVTVNLVP